MTINNDSMNNADKFIADLENIITQDSEAACVALKDVGVAQDSARVKFPDLDISQYPCMQILGDTDGFTFKNEHKGMANQ